MPADLTRYYRDDPYNTPLGLDNKPIGGGPWIRVGTIEDSCDGKHCYNNGRLAVACAATECPEGQVAIFVTRPTDINQDMIRHAGFKSGSFWIPLSNGERPENTHQKMFLDETYKAREFQGDNRLQVLWGTKVTGAAFTEKGSTQEVMIPQFTDPLLFDTFNRRRGILTFVDQEGIQYITADSERTRQIFKENGMRHNPNLDVPFANDEKLVSSKRDFIWSNSLEAIIPGLQNTMAYKRGGANKPVAMS